MAGSSSFGKIAPARLCSKIPVDSPLNDFLCCNCNYPVVRARQIIGCGCRICEICCSHFRKSSKESKIQCRKCHLMFYVDQTFRDKASDNELMRRSFPCFYIECSWEGSAFDYRDHIAVCRFADVKCINPGCNQTFLKEEQDQHEVICKFKLFSCQWCKKEIQLNSKQQHELDVCQEYVMNCPTGCGESIKRKNIKDHVDNFCKRQTRPCLFLRYGCSAKGRLDTLEQHKKESVVMHLDMLAKYMSKCDLLLTTEPAKKTTEANQDASKLQSELTDLRDNVTQQLNRLSEESVKLGIVIQDIQTSFQELAVLVQTLQATCYNGQFVWKIPEIGRRREEAKQGKTMSLYSAPFFTGRFGYKLCLRLYLNGDGSGKGTHLSFFLTLMKGEYDALLSWPFLQTVTLILLDQTNKKKHITQSFKPEPSSSSFWRPGPHSDMNIASGCPRFACLSVLSDPNYVQDDTMFFKAQIDLSGLSHP